MRSRRAASSSRARSRVIDSTFSALGIEALTLPSVTYGPNRPFLTTIAAFESGSSPSSARLAARAWPLLRSEEHTSELQSREKLVCRLLLEKKTITAVLG